MLLGRVLALFAGLAVLRTLLGFRAGTNFRRARGCVSRWAVEPEDKIPNKFIAASSRLATPRSFQARAIELAKRLFAAFLAAIGGVRGASAAKQPSIDFDELKAVVNSGRVFVHDDFINNDLLEALQQDIANAEREGRFIPSGLSNRADSLQKFDARRDRAVMPVLGTTGYTSQPLQDFERKLRSLRLALANKLERPSLNDDSIAHETYYSMSKAGAALPRHLDERHEELKGRKGWLNPSRRSISWLLYLSDKSWDLNTDGGHLRAYPVSPLADAPLVPGRTGGVHEGNLQVAWIKLLGVGTYPVYLCVRDGCLLYIVREATGREIISRGFELHDGATGRKESTAQAFTAALLPAYERAELCILEEPERWAQGLLPAGCEVQDVNPKGGRLVVFDSAVLPHEVFPVLDGARGPRLALAGWMHERAASLLLT
jgi:hypothetical protein